MMKALSLVASAVARASLTSQLLFETLEIVTLRDLRRSFAELKADYGVLRAVLLVFIFPDARYVLKRIQERVLRSQTDEKAAIEEVMAFKKSLADDCNMLAVAAAIVAQVAITALSLDNLNNVHWTAKAAFVASLVAGALSVFFACLLQQQISSLFGSDDVKDWLSKPAGERELGIISDLIMAYKKTQSREGQALSEVKEHIKELKPLVSEGRWRKASFNAALMIKIPALLLNWSVGAFLVGLGIYLGFFFSKNPDPSQSHGASLGILITYIVITALGLLLFFTSRLLKYLEGAPIRRLDQAMKLEAPEKSFKTNIGDIFDHLTEAPANLPGLQRPGAGRQVYEYYGTRARSSRGVGAPGTTQRDRGEGRGQEKEASSKHGDGEGERQEEKGSNEHGEIHQPQVDPDSSDLYDEPNPVLKPAVSSTFRRHSLDTNPVRVDPLVATLKALIVAQEQSTASLQALLQKHQEIV